MVDKNKTLEQLYYKNHETPIMLWYIYNSPILRADMIIISSPKVRVPATCLGGRAPPPAPQMLWFP